MTSGLRCINCDSYYSQHGDAVSRIYNGNSYCEDCFKFVREHDKRVRDEKTKENKKR